MALGFKIGNEDLELPPGTVLEVERNNPFLQLNEEILGEYSLPIEFGATPKNIRLTKYAPLLQSKVNAEGIEVQCYDNGLQDSIGRLKIEKLPGNLNRVQNGRISGYYLTGVSHFYQDAKGKKLRDIDLGGNRNFAGDNFNRNGAGFWGHIHKVIDAPAGYGTSGYDYAFFPTVNNDFGSNFGDYLLVNNMVYEGGTVNFARLNNYNYANAIIPFPYLALVIKKAFDLVGWKVEGEILNDPDFLKVTMISAMGIHWGWGMLTAQGMFSNINFDLAHSLPSVTVNEFLLSIRNRFGWWYDIDRRKKVVRILQLKNVAATTVKEYTYKASPVITKSILPEKRIFSIKVNGSNTDVNFTGVEFKGNLEGFANLPAPVEAIKEHVYLVVNENNYYICQPDDAGVFSWQLFTPNTISVVPEGATEEISTSCQVPEMMKYNNYLDFLPRWDDSGGIPGITNVDDYSGSIVVCFYHGKRNNKLGQPVPLGSHHIYDSTGIKVVNWSLSLKGKTMDGEEVGLYQMNWKAFLDKMITSEIMEVTLYLTRNEFAEMRFSDIISIAGVRMFAAKMKYTIPYNGTVQLTECSRL